MTSSPHSQNPCFVESSFWQQGYRIIAGIDEVGRGPLAGPVLAAAVIFPPDLLIPGVTDSKCLTGRQRQALFPIIRKKALAIGLGLVGPREIDQFNIHQASLMAMKRAVERLPLYPDLVLVDGRHLLDISFPQVCMIKGDLLSHSIGAASIIAKVVRDKIMESCHIRYPNYNFFNNKGYGTQEHLNALQEHGPCLFHRLSFRGVCSNE